MQSLTAKAFFEKSDWQSACIIDVRSPDEFAACYLPGSVNVPLDHIEQGDESKIPHDRPVYLLCRSGMRSQRARELLESHGYTNLVCITGGVLECTKIPGKIIWKSRVLPLMRQVQIAAGGLVVLGIVLSQWIHPAFIFLSLFVGCGLVFAGLTGLCGMAILLSRMPWNRWPTTSCKTLTQEKP